MTLGLSLAVVFSYYFLLRWDETKHTHFLLINERIDKNVKFKYIFFQIRV